MKLEQTSGGIRLRLRVQPGARKTAIVGEHGDALKLAVQAPPEDGRANDAVIELLAETLGLKRSAITLVSGQTRRDKIVEIAGLSADQVRGRLTPANQDGG